MIGGNCYLFVTMTGPFWHEGLRFECQRSGRCCTNHGGHDYVFLAIEDRRAIAKHLGLKTAQFTKRYCAKLEHRFYLVDHGPDCRFLKEGRCSIYEARPKQCRTWPFWRDNMTLRGWREEVASFCPGIGKGRLYSSQEIEASFREHDE